MFSFIRLSNLHRRIVYPIIELFIILFSENKKELSFPRHTKYIAYRCFLPNLAGFTRFNCAGPNSKYGGGKGIRTLDTVAHIHTFQACSFDQLGHPSKFLERKILIQRGKMQANIRILTIQQSQYTVRQRICLRKHRRRRLL